MAGRPKRRAARRALMNPESGWSVWSVWVAGPEGDAYDIAVRAPSGEAAILKVLEEEEGYTISAKAADRYYMGTASENYKNDAAERTGYGSGYFRPPGYGRKRRR
jgi:hypothetical protein